MGNLQNKKKKTSTDSFVDLSASF